MATAYDPFRDLDRMASALFETRRGPRRMPMDLYRDGDHYVLSADLPGIDPGSVDIDVDGQLLTIRAERTLPSGEGVKWIVREPLHVVVGAQRALGADREQLAVDIDVDRTRVDARQIGREHVVVAVTVQVDGHHPRPLPRVEHARSEAVELTERVPVHGHCLLLPVGRLRGLLSQT